MSSKSGNFYTDDPTLHRVFGRVADTDPLAILTAAKNEPPTAVRPNLALRALDYLRENHISPGDPTLELYSSFLDVRMIVTAGMNNTIPPLDKQEALGVARHSKTAHFLAEMALHPSEDYTPLVLNNPGAVVVGSRQYLALEPPDALDYSVGKGCPFAGDNPAKKRYPIFLKYASWVAQFSAHEYFEEKDSQGV